MQLGSNDDLERRGLWIAAMAVMVLAASARADPI